MKSQRNGAYALNQTTGSADAFPKLFSPDDYAGVREYFARCTGYSVTPLRSLARRARRIGIRELLVKDESARLGLNSFKMLGVSYAIHRLFADGDLKTNSIVVCATDGNHGRSLARVARQNQLRSKVYVHIRSSSACRKAIAAEGAEVIVKGGNYDECVQIAADEAVKNGWVLVSDTSRAGSAKVPKLVMAGYTMLISEAVTQWREPPNLVLVQAGVGGLACAVISALIELYNVNRPLIASCEPETAACVLESIRAGTPVAARGSLKTIMAGLSCGAVSSTAWPTLRFGLDACIAVADQDCREALLSLAQPEAGDPQILAGESGACGAAALNAILRRREFLPVRDRLGVGPQTCVLLINTEAPTPAEG